MLTAAVLAPCNASVSPDAAAAAAAAETALSGAECRVSDACNRRRCTQSRCVLVAGRTLAIAQQ